MPTGNADKIIQAEKKKFIVSAVLALVLLFISCSSRRHITLDTDAVAANNRGVGLMGQFDNEAAMQVFQGLARKYPGNADIQTNLAIATFNRQNEGDEQTALAILGRVLELEPTHTRARYCSGLLELYQGRPAKALEYLQAVLEADPDDASVLYFIGKTLMQMERYEEALDYFKRTTARDPYIRSAYYGIIMALRQLGKMDDALAVMGEFQRLQKNPRARLVEFKYTKMGSKAEVLAIDQPKSTPTKKPTGNLFNPVITITGNEQTAWQIQPAADKPGRSSITICDINGDKTPDIFIPGAIQAANGQGNALLLGNPEKETYTLNNRHPLTGVSEVNAALWGDINNDGRVDVYLCRRGPNQLWYQEAGGEWRDMTGETGTANGSLDTVDGALFDADHDGDLDIFLINADGPNELLNNNRDDSFRPLAADYGLKGTNGASRSVVIADLDADRDADIIVINRQPPHNVYINQRLWNYQPARGFEAFIAADIQAAVSGDVDTDGLIELYTLDSRGALTRWRPNAANTWSGVALTSKEIKSAAQPGQSRLSLVDIDGDGALDIIVSDSNRWWAASFDGNQLKPLFTFSVPGEEKNGIAAWSVIASPCGPSVLGWSPGQPPVLWSPGPGRYSFALLTLSGMKDTGSTWRSNASGIGTHLEVRVDSRWTVLDTFRADSGPGQSLQPVTVGMGGAARIDFAAFDWSDGVYQTELGLEAGKLHEIIETQRQLSSCPVLFAWNGETFEFVSDFLGVGGLGYAVGPGQYSEPRPWENFMLPQGLIQPRSGRLLLKVTEPMEEITYLDAVRLYAYDLPPGWSMTMDERMGISQPFPSGLPRFYRNIIIPMEVVNDRNEDVTAVVCQRDLNAAAPGKLDLRFIGRLEQDHVLTLTFPRALDSFPGQALLVADGWVEYPYSQTNFAAWQAGADYRAPTVEVRRPGGEWINVLEQFGYPAGMPRQMSVPLTPLPKGVTQMRIRTNQEIYWDRLAVVFVEDCPQVQRHELVLESARLERMGFPLRIDFPQRLPDYDYEKRTPFWDTHFLEGYYTRFGSVDELVEAKDNAVVIFGAGEGVHLEFREPPRPLMAGWTRVFVLETDGWCKDMDLYTNTGETVEPLPAAGKRSARADRLHRSYNTRYLSGKQ